MTKEKFPQIIICHSSALKMNNKNLHSNDWWIDSYIYLQRHRISEGSWSFSIRTWPTSDTLLFEVPVVITVLSREWQFYFSDSEGHIFRIVHTWEIVISNEEILSQNK